MNTLFRSIIAVALVGALAATSGCGVGATFSPTGPPVSESAAPAADAAIASASVTQSAIATQPADLAHLKLTLKKRWGGLTQPLYLTNAGDGSGRLFVVEQTGRVKVIKRGVVLAKPYLDLHTRVSTGGERGLLGIAFSPKFKTDGKLYVDYTDTSGNTVIARYTTAVTSASAPEWNAPTRLLRITQPYPNHNGGGLLFGPDGYLYIGMGDGGSGGDPGKRAQNRKVLLGKILRIDVSKATATKPYAIPATNPYYLTTNTSLKPLPEVWSIGMRNPWRFSFDASGSMWVADVGQDAWEEIDRVAKTTVSARASKGGLNFGWNRYEGGHYYPSGALVPNASRSSSYVWPLYNYPHPTGESISGGYVYRGSAYPALRGTYVFADYVKGWVAGIRTTAPNGTALPKAQERTLLSTSLHPASFGVDQSNELYLVDHNGSVYQVQGAAK